MYVFRITPITEYPDGMRLGGNRTLCEMTARDFREATSETPPERTNGCTFRRTTPEHARDWVASGGHHETALYRGWDRQGRERIMYARDGF